MPTKKTKILVVGQNLHEGGAERFISILLRHLNRNNFNFELCLMRGPLTYGVPADVNITLLNKTKPWHWPRTVWRLKNIISKFSPDIIISTVALMNILTGTALILSSVNPHWIQFVVAFPMGDSWFSRLCSQRFFLRADQTIVNSYDLKNALIDSQPKLKNRIQVLYTPVDCNGITFLSDEKGEAYMPIECRPIILTVGRLVSVKRPDLLLDAFFLVRQQFDAALWFCGEGRLLQDLQKKVKSLGLQDDVHFFGHLSNPFPLVGRASIFVLSSDHEGLPQALIEAQALGVPAVSTNCKTGPREIIENEQTGLLTPVGDSRALANAICQLLSSPETREVMGQRAAKRAHRLFGVTHILKEWEQLFLSAALNKG